MGKKKTKLINNDELIREEEEKFTAQVNMIRKLIDENRSLPFISQVIDKINENKRKDTDLHTYTLIKCLSALKANDDNSYYYLSVLYFIKEKLKLELTENELISNFKKTYSPKSEREKIILRELEHLFQNKDNIITPDEVERKYGIKDEPISNSLLMPNNFIITIHDINTTSSITIDPSKDFTLKDDALSIKEVGENYILGIHITDVSNFLISGMPLEAFAKDKFRTLYLPDKVIHMLPDIISRSYLSLEQNTRKNVLSLYLTISKQGLILKSEFVYENIEIEKNLTYLESERILRNIDKSTPKLERTLKLLDHITYLLDNKYSLNKYLDMQVEKEDELDDESHRSMVIVQSCMVLYNSYIAFNMGEKKDFPFIYRVHKKPTVVKIYENAGEKNNTAQFLEEAFYSMENIGHYGLGQTHYAHASSGIRRYMDYISQRLYKLSLQKLSVKELKELEKEIIALVEYANKKEKEIRTFLPEYEYSYHKHFTL